VSLQEFDSFDCCK